MEAEREYRKRLEGGNPGDVVNQTEYPEHFFRCSVCGKLFTTKKWVKVRGHDMLECPYCSAAVGLYAVYLTDRERDWHREHRTPIPDAGILGPTPYGTCYQDASNFLMKQDEGYLVHGSVQLSAEAPRISHAWVELPTGWVWEPQTGRYYTVEDFRVMSPVEECRYTVEEAIIMAVRSGNHGPWSDEERAQWIQ